MRGDRPASAGTRAAGGRISIWAAGVVGIALVVAAGVWVMVVLAPTYAEDLSVENPNEYPVQVQTRGSDSQGWLSVGTVPAGQTYDPQHVLDQGETWTFRFSHRDIAVERTYQRDELDARGWQVTVPDELEQRLQEEGITPQESSPFEEPSP